MGRASPQALAEGTAEVGEELVMPLLVGQLLSGCLLGKEEQLQKQSVWKGSLVIAGLGRQVGGGLVALTKGQLSEGQEHPIRDKGPLAHLVPEDVLPLICYSPRTHPGHTPGHTPIPATVS